ncbi:MAG: hypothetical protein HYR55_07265 [Acidobacteria bacterium]|nr:hypothetical protein [Acidobacteriota bacterium]MBI3658017.1 hypothetical protein [Acidobacteriota bacterium]
MLSAVFGIARSGMEAAVTRLSVAANNISNMNTDGFKAALTMDVEGPAGLGVRTTIVVPPQPGPVALGEDGRTRTLSNTDLAGDSVQIILAQRSYEANLKAFQTADQLQEATLSLMA